MQIRNLVSRFEQKGSGAFALAMLGFVFMAFSANAANILLYRGPSSDAYNDNAANELAALLIAGGNTVTQVQISAGQCPAETWGAPYDQVWDFRFAQVAGCPSSGNFDDFSACWQTKATNYLKNCGKLFLLGENSAYGGRNTNLVAYLKTIGAVSASFGACPDWSGANNTSNMEDDRVGLMNLNTPLPNGATQYVSYAMGGMPVGPAGFNVLNAAATDFADWGPATGEQWNNGDNNTRSVAAGWSGSAALPGTGGAACSVGKLFMTWDQSAFDSGSMYVGANKTITDQFFKGVAQWLGTAACVCGTPSDTPSRTATRTMTYTLTATPSFTPTLTATRTASSTLTFTVTFTPTATLTRTPTPSPTSTFTLIATPNITLTRTPTLSPTSTFTLTATPSLTLTRTPTQTVSSTRTTTPTATVTDTVSSTATKTATVTVTFLDTYTYSPTVTPTRTATLTHTSTRTQTPSSTPTLSYSSTETNTPSKTETPTYTDTSQFTATNTATVTATPSVTKSSTPSSTKTASPTASDSATVTYTRTDTSTVTATLTFSPSSTLTPTPSPSPSRTDSPTVTVSPSDTGTLTRSPTVTITPVPMPDHLNITLYNSAGEKVRSLFDGTAQFIPASIGLDSALLAAGSGASVGLDLQGSQVNGSGSLSWSGENDSGQIVDGGMYYFKLEFTDTFGTVTAVTQSINVIRTVGETTLEVFNSAGELVMSKNLNSLAPGAVDFNPEGTVFSPSNDPSAVMSSQNSMRFDIKKAGGGFSSWDWDGRNSQGSVVASGTYTVRLSSTQQGGAKMVVLRSVMVLKNGLDIQDPAPQLAENPLKQGHSIEIHYNLFPGCRATARLDNVAGELIAQASDQQGDGSLSIPAGSLAAGIYLIEFELKDGQATRYRKLIKVAISR